MLVLSRTFVSLLALLAIMTAYPSPAKAMGEAISQQSEISLVQLRERIDSLLQERGIPGVGIGLVSRDSVIWSGGIGVANLASGEPVTGATLFRMASVTKSFLGLGFQKLVEEGRIDLYTPLSELVPEVSIHNPWDNTDPVRVVHLLEHTSGFDDSHFYEYVNLTQDPNIPLLNVLNISPNTRNVRWQPGTRMSYSNHGYLLAGYVMEKVTGERFEDCLSRVILDPIGMTASAFRLADIDSRLLAQGYDDDNSEYPMLLNLSRPAANLVSSTDDMARFVQCLLNRGTINGEVVLKAESIARAEMATTTLAAQAGLAAGYGLGISSKYRRGFLSFDHGGDIGGFSSEYVYFPDLGLGCVVMANKLESSGVIALRNACLDYLLGPDKPPAVAAAAIAPATLEQYEGYYEFRSPRSQFTAFMDILLSGVTLFVERDTLWMKTFAGEASALVPVTETKFRAVSDPAATMAFVEDQSHRLVLTGSKGYYEHGSYVYAVFRLVLFVGAIAAAVSTLMYALYWIPVCLFRRFFKKGVFPPYLRLRILPLAATVSLLIAVVAFEAESLVDLLLSGFKTIGMMVFFLSTLIFAVLSFFSAVYSVFSFSKPVGLVARGYAILVSFALLGLALYLGLSGVIGFRAWSY